MRSSRSTPLASPLLAAAVLAVAPGSGCGEPDVPGRPTWREVEPILRGNCTHCHGATAAETGSAGGITYRLDFFDMTREVCGDAAAVLDGAPLAGAWAQLIGTDVAPPRGGRGRMPPAPAEPLGDWERETLRRWSLAPARGVPRRDNARPNIYLGGKSARADRSLAFSAIVDDPDGEPVVGALRFGEHTLGIDRSGSFAAILDTSAWPAGWYPVTATLCDGWSSVSYELGYLEVRHQ